MDFFVVSQVPISIHVYVRSRYETIMKKFTIYDVNFIINNTMIIFLNVNLTVNDIQLLYSCINHESNGLKKVLTVECENS